MLPTLIQRLEEAECPDRELDALIAIAIFDHVDLPSSGGRLARGEAGYECGDQHWRNRATPKVTASLDAAIGLVERVLSDREWAVWRDDENRYFMARIPNDNWDEATDNIDAKGATAPLALCLALLKALQHKEQAQ